jgi:hypothetical protein
MSDNPPEVIVTREIFDALSSGRGDWHHTVLPGEAAVDVIYYENDVRKSYISINLDAAEAFAAAIVACANEMRAAGA